MIKINAAFLIIGMIAKKYVHLINFNLVNSGI